MYVIFSLHCKETTENDSKPIHLGRPIQKYNRIEEGRERALEMEIEGLSITRCTKLLFGAQRWNSKRFKASVQPSPRIRRRRNQYFSAKCFSNKHVQSLARDDSQFTYKDDLPEEPFWLSLMKEAIWAVKSLFIFLVEQPSQLKYIEWPSFQSTLKTATLTLVIVALLIVGLSTVDSILCYLLALLLRKPA